MKKEYILLILLVSIFCGCNSTIGENEDKQVEEILLGSSSNAVNTRALADFPNGGSIGVVAAVQYNPENPGAHWTEYTDISNAEATATSFSNGTYGFTWKQTKYWPFDGSNLYFMAYSPVASGNNYYLLSDDNTSVFMTLDPNLPDVMYASNNPNPQPYNKTSGVVELGEFRHVLSKLTIQVVANEAMSANIVVNNLSVSTNMRSGQFLFDRGDDGLIVETAPSRYVATLASGQVSFKAQPLVSTLLLFPGTQDDVEVSITLLDTSNNLTYTRDYMVSFFTNTTNTEPVILERAKNTVLTINVLNIGVNDTDRNIRLEGALKDWDYQGDFGVSIN